MYQASNADLLVPNGSFVNYDQSSRNNKSPGDTHQTGLNPQVQNVKQQVNPREIPAAYNPNNQYYQQADCFQQQHQSNQQVISDSRRQFETLNTEAIATFSLDDIGAIINSEDFNDIIKANPQELQNHETSRQNEHYTQIGEKTQDKYINIEHPQLDNISQNPQFKPDYLDNHRKFIDLYDLAGDCQQLEPIGELMAASSNRNHFVPTATHPNAQLEDKKSRPYIEIVEQPAKCALRFRYKCEGRSAGSLPGVNSSADNKTFPAIRIANYVGRAVIVISCVTKDPPYRAHPHNIVGKEGCKKGICTIVINNEPNMIRSFTSLGIQCVKRKDIEESLALREAINVDPFRNGFSHKLNASNIDLNVVRLSFQVFIEGSTPNKCDVPLKPVVSEPIHDKKAMSDLVITKLSHCSAPATGGREVILLCDRISKDDIQIRFYEERDNEVSWEKLVDLSPADVHKQVAICFKTPKYYNENITQPVMVRVQLRRISDHQVSEPRLFQFLPCESDEDIISRKRQKIEWANIL